MAPKFLILVFLLLASFSNGGATSSNCKLDIELAMLKASCLTVNDYQEMTGNLIPGKLAHSYVSSSIEFAVSMIAITKLRSSLKVPPLPSWHAYNHTEGSDEELRLAGSVQDYYGLKERVLSRGGYSRETFSDENIDTIASFFDKKFPAIRQYFQKTAEELRLKHQKMNNLDRKSVDGIVADYEKTYQRILKAVGRMPWLPCRSNSNLAWDDDYESPASNSSSPLINIDDVLININSSCLFDGDTQKLTGNKLHIKWTSSKRDMFLFAVQVMAVQELRATLQFNEGDQLLKKYYLLKERQAFDPELDQNLLISPPYISYLDQRFPMLRVMYQQKFENVRGSPQKIDIETIDRLIDEYWDVVPLVKEATDTMLKSRAYVSFFNYVQRVCTNGTVVLGTDTLQALGERWF